MPWADFSFLLESSTNMDVCGWIGCFLDLRYWFDDDGLLFRASVVSILVGSCSCPLSFFPGCEVGLLVFFPAWLLWLWSKEVPVMHALRCDQWRCGCVHHEAFQPSLEGSRLGSGLECVGLGWIRVGSSWVGFCVL